MATEPGQIPGAVGAHEATASDQETERLIHDEMVANAIESPGPSPKVGSQRTALPTAGGATASGTGSRAKKAKLRAASSEYVPSTSLAAKGAAASSEARRASEPDATAAAAATGHPGHASFFATEAIISGMVRDPKVMKSDLDSHAAAQEYEMHHRKKRDAKLAGSSVPETIREGAMVSEMGERKETVTSVPSDEMGLRIPEWKKSAGHKGVLGFGSSHGTFDFGGHQSALPPLSKSEVWSRRLCCCLPRHRQRHAKARKHWAIMRRAVKAAGVFAKLGLPVRPSLWQRIFHLAPGQLLEVHMTDVVQYKFVIHPKSRFRRAWDILMMLFVLTLLFWVPFQLGFDYKTGLEGSFLAGFWFIVDWFIDIFFMVDILVNFRTAYFDDGDLIQRPRQIARHYMKVWFYIDMVATIPYSRFTDAAVSDTGNFAQLPRVLRFTRMARLMRLLRLFRVRKVLEDLEEAGIAFSAILRLAGMCFWMITLSHFVGCAWFFTASMNDLDETTWAHRAGIVADDEFSHKYFVSVYWSFVTITTVGYGDIVPVNDGERVFVLAVLLVGVLFFAWAVGKITNMLAQVNASSEQFQSRMDSINEFMRYRNLPKGLRKRIRRYYENFWPRGIYFNEGAILGELSFNLRRDVAFHLNRDLIMSVPFFSGADPVFVSELIMRLRPRHAMAGDLIVMIGEIGREMFLLQKGEVVVTDYSGTRHTSLYEGSFFGEIAVLEDSLRRTSNVRAKTACELFSLSKVDLSEVLKDFPEFADALHAVADARLQKSVEEFAEDADETKRELSRKMARVFSNANIKGPRELTEAERSHAAGLAAALDPEVRRRRREKQRSGHLDRTHSSAPKMLEGSGGVPAGAAVSAAAQHMHGREGSGEGSSAFSDDGSSVGDVRRVVTVTSMPGPPSIGTRRMSGSGAGGPRIARPSALGVGFSRAAALLEESLRTITHIEEDPAVGVEDAADLDLAAADEASHRLEREGHAEGPSRTASEILSRANSAATLVASKEIRAMRSRMHADVTALNERIDHLEAPLNQLISKVETLTSAVMDLRTAAVAGGRSR